MRVVLRQYTCGNLLQSNGIQMRVLALEANLIAVLDGKGFQAWAWLPWEGASEL